MTETTLNKHLNKLDTIIFQNYENRKDINEIIEIINDVRIYIIDSTPNRDREFNKRSFIVMLEFINYMIQESFHPITDQFISHLTSLRLLIIKFKSNHLYITDEEIDFDNQCNSFLKRYVVNDDKDKDKDEDVI